jgi:hypothetical protein
MPRLAVVQHPPALLDSKPLPNGSFRCVRKSPCASVQFASRCVLVECQSQSGSRCTHRKNTGLAPAKAIFAIDLKAA